MPTARETVAEVAAETGTALIRVDTTTRILREQADADGYDYWLRTGRGIRDAAVQPHHLINAIVALMVQPSEGPELVRRLRALKLIRTTDKRQSSENMLVGIRSFTERQEPFADGPASLGLLLDEIMLALSGRRSAEGPGLSKLILQCTPMVRVRLTGTLSAEVVWPYQDGKGDITDAFASPDLDLPAAEYGLFDRIIEISADQFRRMAKILGTDTNQPTLIPETANTASKNETAAPGPGKDTSAAALNDQPAQTELGASQPQDMGEREKSQPPSNMRTGRPHHSKRSDTHARRRYDFPSGVAA